MKPDSKHISLRAVAILALFAAITILAMRTRLAARRRPRLKNLSPHLPLPTEPISLPEPLITPLPTEPVAVDLLAAAFQGKPLTAFKGWLDLAIPILALIELGVAIPAWRSRLPGR